MQRPESKPWEHDGPEEHFFLGAGGIQIHSHEYAHILPYIR